MKKRLEWNRKPMLSAPRKVSLDMMGDQHDEKLLDRSGGETVCDTQNSSIKVQMWGEKMTFQGNRKKKGFGSTECDNCLSPWEEYV